MSWGKIRPSCFRIQNILKKFVTEQTGWDWEVRQLNVGTEAHPAQPSQNPAVTGPHRQEDR